MATVNPRQPRAVVTAQPFSVLRPSQGPGRQAQCANCSFTLHSGRAPGHAQDLDLRSQTPQGQPHRSTTLGAQQMPSGQRWLQGPTSSLVPPLAESCPHGSLVSYHIFPDLHRVFSGGGNPSPPYYQKKVLSLFFSRRTQSLMCYA